MTVPASADTTALTSIGARVRSLRKEYHLTQQQLADLAGVSDATVRQIEHGTGHSTLTSLLAVLTVLGLTLEVS